MSAGTGEAGHSEIAATLGRCVSVKSHLIDSAMCTVPSLSTHVLNFEE